MTREMFELYIIFFFRCTENPARHKGRKKIRHKKEKNIIIRLTCCKRQHSQNKKNHFAKNSWHCVYAVQLSKENIFLQQRALLLSFPLHVYQLLLFSFLVSKFVFDSLPCLKLLQICGWVETRLVKTGCCQNTSTVAAIISFYPHLCYSEMITHAHMHLP